MKPEFLKYRAYLMRVFVKGFPVTREMKVAELLLMPKNNNNNNNNKQRDKSVNKLVINNLLWTIHLFPV